MNKVEQGLAESYGMKLVEAIDRQTTAIKYLADVLGFKADSLNPKDEQGKVGVTLSISADEPKVKAVEPTIAPIVEPTPPVELGDIKTQLNALAKKFGKQEAFDLISKYVESKKPADLKPEQYQPIYSDIAARLAA